MSEVINSNYNYGETFKKLYYHLYSNSNSSRAERIMSDLAKLLLFKLANDRISEKKVLDDFLSGKSNANDSLIPLLRTCFPGLVEEGEQFALNDEALRRGLEEIQGIDFLNAPAHIIGDAFQSLIGPNIRGDKGQFFTPRSVVKCMVEILAPSNSDTIADPACGTGGFLAEAYSYLSVKYSKNELNGKLIGIDKDKDLAYLSSALLEITTHGMATIHNNNSLTLLKSRKIIDTSYFAEIVLTNPPFGSKIGVADTEILQNYSLGHIWQTVDGKWQETDQIATVQDPQILFLELCIAMLKPGGKLGIVLPEGVFGNKTLGYVWEFILERGRIIGMIDCPRTTFQPSTDTKTNILFFRKNTEENVAESKNTFPVAVAIHCGHDRRGRSIKTNGDFYPDDFPRIGKEYSANEKEGIWVRCAPKTSYLVPRYYHNQTTLGELSQLGELISFRQLIRHGYITIRKGHEVGSEAYGTGNVPFVRTSDINNFEISSDPSKSISEEVYNQYAHQQQLKEGDILLVADGRYRIGNLAIINQFNLKSIIQSHIKIISLSPEAPFEPYEFLYILNLPLVQQQMRNLIFIQSTLGTIGRRLEEVKIPVVKNNPNWDAAILEFKSVVSERARLLSRIQGIEHHFEL